MYRKFQADSLFNGTQLLNENHVLICGEDGTIDSVQHLSEAGEGIQKLNGILCPGFVNAHCHIELSHMKGMIPKGTGLVRFVQSVMSQRSGGGENKQAAMESAVQELYDSGTVAVGDICNTADSIAVKKESPLYWHNFIEISGFVESAADARFELSKAVKDSFGNAGILPTSTSFSPHAPYSVSANLFSLINAHTAGEVVSIHNQETAAEDELYQERSGEFLKLYEHFGINIDSFIPTGKRSFPSWLPRFTNGQSIISVHNTFTNQQDISFSGFYPKYKSLHFCLCPNANLYIENRLPPLQLLMENHADILLGTDSYASNDQLNMMHEIKTIRQNFPGLPLETILGWATLNGAKALGIEAVYGSFSAGKKPGILLLGQDSAKRLL